MAASDRPIDLVHSAWLWDYSAMTEQSTTAERASERRDNEKKANAAQLAVALTRTLSLGVFRGKCKCGLMLSERDTAAKSDLYSCPRCGRKGEPVTA